MASQKNRIVVGVGGWTYEPWRDNFYPAGLPKSRELEYASRKLTAIEVNGTFYGAQKPATFAKWRDETPDDFVFALKAIQYATHRRVLAEGADSVKRFIDSGISELGRKLGPLVWQFAPTKRFDAADFETFFELLPAEVDGIALRHVMDVRHESFMVPEYLALARKHKVATVFCDSDAYPSFCDLTGDFVYARLMRTRPEIATGYAPEELKQWAGNAKTWAAGGEPAGLPCIEADTPAPVEPRDVFMFFISGAKERAPAAAMGLLKALG
jgi:uncharacterized protein YecE (DUF72 family)